MDEDYITIDARIREARRLRAEAAGELCAAGLLQAKRLIAAGRFHGQHLLAALASRVHAALQHRRPAHR